MEINNDYLDDNQIFDILDQMNYEENNRDEDKKTTKDTCEACGTRDTIIIDTVNGNTVCNKCGNISKELFDENNEVSYNNDNGYSKDGGQKNSPINVFCPQSSLGTTIRIHPNNKLKTLEIWNAIPYKERSLGIVLKEIQRLCKEANILKCIEDDAKISMKNISECKHLTGKNKGKTIIIRGTRRQGLIVACIFYACLRKGQTRSPKELAKIAGLKDNDITKGCKTFIKLLKCKKMEYELKSSMPEHFVPRFCKQLHIKNEYVDQVLSIVRNIQKLNIASVHTPLTVAISGIVLMIENNNLAITRKDIATKFQISEVTIIKTYKKIEEYKNVLTDNELTNDLLICLQEEKNKLKIPDSLKQKYDAIKNNKIELSSEESEESEPSGKEQKNKKNKMIKINMNTDLDKYTDDFNVDLYSKLAETENYYNEVIKNLIYQNQ